jgi:hypothetical protein
MGRFIALLYGLVSYVAFFVTILYAIGFVSGLGVPKTIDAGPVVPTAEALIVNLVAIRTEISRTQHIRAARKPCAHAAILAMAPDASSGLAGRQSANRYGDAWAIARRLGDRVHQHVPD